MEKTVDAIREDESLRKDILWELLEWNHRLDVDMLDAHLLSRRSDTAAARRLEVLQLWGEAHDTPKAWLPTHSGTLGTWDEPMDIPSLVTRWVSLVRSWPTCPSAVRAFDPAQRNTKFEELLPAIIKFYVDEFRTVFGRLPVPPVCARK